MLKEIGTYLTAEKQESALFMLAGLIAIGFAAWLWMNGHRLKSMAFPLLAVALIQIVVGSTVFLRTDTQIATLNEQLNVAPAQFKAAEVSRMDAVMKNFRVYKVIEMALLAIGLLMLALAQKSDMATGIGAGLMMQAAFMLCLDMFAEARGSDYLKAVMRFTP